MKKKFKLFATIGSLALAVCMMTIGVLAAAQVTLNVNSTVSFSSVSSFVDISASVTGFASQEKGKEDTYTFTHDKTKPNKAPGAWDVGALTFDESHSSIVYTIKVTNHSEHNVSIAVTGTPSAIAGQLTVTEGKTGNDSIKPNGNATYKLTLTVTDFSQNLASTQVNLVVTIDKVAE